MGYRLLRDGKRVTRLVSITIDYTRSPRNGKRATHTQCVVTIDYTMNIIYIVLATAQTAIYTDSGIQTAIYRASPTQTNRVHEYIQIIYNQSIKILQP